MYNLTHMTVSEMAHASTRLRKLGRGAGSMEEASQRIASFFFDELGAPDGQQRGCVLVRVYKTHRFGELPPDLRDFATNVSRGPLPSQAPCLALLGTVGVESAWCARQRSNGHRAIPLPSVEAVARLPMVAQLVSQLGFDVASLINGAKETLLDQDEQTFNVFYIPTALDSPFVPAQDFVRQYEVQSVLGCGGQLPDGELYAVIAFARVTISRETAEIFKPLALAAKLALLPFLNATFDEDARVAPAG
jgi:two-component system NtrC family sensor kinase